MADATLKMLLLGEDRSASRALNKVGDSADRTSHKADDLDLGLGELAGRMSKVMTVAGAAGPAIMFVGSALSAAAAGGTALAGAVGPAAVAGLAAYAGGLLAIKSAGLVSKFALEGVTEAADGDKKAMEKLTPEGRKLARTLGGLHPEIESVRRAAQKGMFPGVDDAITRLSGSYLPLLRRGARQTGEELGLLAQRGGQMAASGPWRKDFGTLTRANAQNLGLMGTSGLNLANTARSLLIIALPLIHMFFDWAAGATASVDAMVQAKRESGELAAFWGRAADNGAALGHILGNLATGLFNIFRIGGSGQGQTMLQNLEGMSAQFESWTKSEGGRRSITKWFADGRKNLEAMGRLLGDTSKGLSGLGSGEQLAPLIDQLRTEVLPPLLRFLDNASASGALNELVSAIGSLAGVFADLSEHDGSLKAFATTLKTVADAAAWVVQNVPGAGTALGALFTVAGTGAALKFLGLGGVINLLGTALSGLATRFGVAAGAASAETGAITLNSIAHRASMTTAGTWLGVKALELAAWIRTAAAAVASTAATLASNAAMLVVRGGILAWTAAQWLLNAALTANPIGIVVVLIAALVAGLIYAYKHSETFRKIVDGAFRAVGTAAKWMWEKMIRPYLSFMISLWMTVVGALVNGAAKAFGWVPGLGPKLRAAANWFNEFRDSVNAKLRGIKDRNVKVRADDSSARSTIRNFNAYLNRMTGPRSIDVRAQTTRGAGMVPGRNAVGTAFFSGGPTWVGERGPELIDAPRGSRIHTAADSARAMQDAQRQLADPGYIVVVVKDESGVVLEQKLAKVKRTRGGQPLAFEAKK